jgi:glycosyltransferase involved in cell wall biosynthesis
MKKILIFTSSYLPDIKAGGPVRSIENLVNAICDDFIIHIITLDSLKIGKSKSSVYINQISNSKVIYLKDNINKYGMMLSIINKGGYDIFYINSFFDINFTLYPLLISKFIKNKIRIIIAPRGQFGKAAIRHKKIRKTIYLGITKSIRVYNNVIWHFTSNDEKLDVIKKLKIDENYVIQNINTNMRGIIIDKNKRSGELTIITVGRISYMKNYPYLFNCLRYINRGKIKLKIIGYIEDKQIYKECKKIENGLKNIEVEWFGLKDQYFIEKEINKSHLFISPTLGENYGHSIYESLSLGCPVLISNNTQLKDLEKYNAGYVVPLENKNRFIEIINMYINMNNKEYTYNYEQVLKYYNNYIGNKMKDNIVQYKNMFSK